MGSDTITWLITSTTYGTWLPGDSRGFVGRVWEIRPEDTETDSKRLSHNLPGATYDQDIAGLQDASRELMKGEPILFTAEQASVVLAQFQETARYRSWQLDAASIMANHIHLVVTAPSGVRSDAILRDLKSYASRALNKQWPKPKSETWWTSSGSRRMLPNAHAVTSAIRYVMNQYRVLAQWLNPIHREEIGDQASGGR